MTLPALRSLRDLLEVAAWLEAMAATEKHAGNVREAQAHLNAAKLLRARNEQETTEPNAYVCGKCNKMFSGPPRG